MKLQSVGGAETLETILSYFGIQSELLNTVVYHRFKNVGIQFPNAYEENTPDVMEWTIDKYTTAEYYIKNGEGNLVAWSGWSSNTFSHCTIVLTKRVESLEEIVKKSL